MQTWLIKTHQAITPHLMGLPHQLCLAVSCQFRTPSIFMLPSLSRRLNQLRRLKPHLCPRMSQTYRVHRTTQGRLRPLSHPLFLPNQGNHGLKPSLSSNLKRPPQNLRRNLWLRVYRKLKL